jgi:hypothetical protein
MDVDGCEFGCFTVSLDKKSRHANTSLYGLYGLHGPFIAVATLLACRCAAMFAGLPQSVCLVVHECGYCRMHSAIFSYAMWPVGRGRGAPPGAEPATG